VSFFKDYKKNKQKQQQITKSDIKKELLKKNRINFLQNHQMQTSSQNLRFYSSFLRPHAASPQQQTEKENEKLLHTYTHTQRSSQKL